MQNEKTSPQQYERMVNLLTEYRDIAQNFTNRSPEIVAAFCEDLANQLNSLRPRQRDVIGWKKVWSDHKSYIKKNLLANKKSFKYCQIIAHLPTPPPPKDKCALNIMSTPPNNFEANIEVRS